MWSENPKDATCGDPKDLIIKLGSYLVPSHNSDHEYEIEQGVETPEAFWSNVSIARSCGWHRTNQEMSPAFSGLGKKHGLSRRIYIEITIDQQ
jgi:hypothetical protein